MDEIPSWELCTSYGRKGEVECMLCKGKGRKTSGFLGDIDIGVCDEYRGSGVLICRHCQGTGRQEKNY